MSNLAIIPARGGSKRIPRKNIKSFLGREIIAYSIQSALESGLFDEVMVSTDDQEIADVAVKYGASVPFFRSDKKSDDFATLADVIEEVLSQYKILGHTFTNVCCLLPTAPFVNANKITLGYKQMLKEGFDAVIPVVSFSYPIQRALVSDENNKITLMHPENEKLRSQDLETTYHDSGQFYWIRMDKFLNYKSLFTPNVGMLHLTELEVQDIDTEIDWELAELKYKLISKF